VYYEEAKDVAQQRIWTFYEAIKDEEKKVKLAAQSLLKRLV